VTIILEDLPTEIKEHILRKVNSDNYQGKPNTYSVTELLYCVRKAYFKRKFPKPLTIEQAFNIYRGRVFDELWSPLFRHNQVRATYRCKTVPITISGKYDFLTTDNPPVLTDLKTTKSLYYITAPSEEYIKQVRFYAYQNSITKAQILYVDFGDAKVFPVEVGDCTELLSEFEAKALQLYMALIYEKIPQKEIKAGAEWICTKCEYLQECNQT
jgi:CRISPR-associated exonuclease Cas4